MKNWESIILNAFVYTSEYMVDMRDNLMEIPLVVVGVCFIFLECKYCGLFR